MKSTHTRDDIYNSLRVGSFASHSCKELSCLEAEIASQTWQKKVMESEEEKSTLETLTSETLKTRFCQKCDQEITKGKEIRFERVLEWERHDVGSRDREAVYSPAKTAIYYFCPDCFGQIEWELAQVERKNNIWWWILFGVCAVGVIALFVIAYKLNSRK